MAVAEEPALTDDASRTKVAIPAVGPWIGGAASSDYVLAGMHDAFIGVWVDVPEGVVAEHVPTALSLVIDTSGSMKGDKIAHARKAALKLIDELEDGDVVSIVTFADEAKVRLGPLVLDHRSRRRARAVVQELHAIGGTALMDGLQQAEGQFWGVADTHLVRRVVMISDGQATIGTSDPHALGTVAEAGMDRGIQVTSIGVGLDYDEETLNALAIRSSGRLYHLTESAELAGLVEREVSLLQATAAANAIVEVLPAPGVTLQSVEMARFARVRDRIHVPLGSMHSGQQRELLLRVRVDAAAMGRKPLASVRFHFKDPTEGGLQRVQESVVAAQVTDSASLVAKHAVPRTAHDGRDALRIRPRPRSIRPGERGQPRPGDLAPRRGGTPAPPQRPASARQGRKEAPDTPSGQHGPPQARRQLRLQDLWSRPARRSPAKPPSSSTPRRWRSTATDGRRQRAASGAATACGEPVAATC